MKKQIISLALIALAAVACTKSDDYKKYQVSGEIPYPGVMDSVKILAGKNRVLLTGLFTSDPKITKYRIFWNNRQDSLEVAVERKGFVDTARTFINNLAEGAISVEVRTYDAAGNKSIPIFAVGNAYGTQYESGVSNRSASATTVTKGGLKITWTPVSPGSPFTRLTYTATDGTVKTMRVPGKDETTLVPDYQYDTKMLVQTAYLPEATAIDTFYTLKPDTLIKSNALAGVYTSGGTRTNYTGPVSNNVVAGTNALSGDKTATAIGADKIELDYANLGGNGWKYVFSYNGTAMTVAPNATMAGAIAAGSFIVHSVSYDKTTGIITVKTAYTNTAGDDRIVEETLTLK